MSDLLPGKHLNQFENHCRNVFCRLWISTGHNFIAGMLCLLPIMHMQTVMKLTKGYHRVVEEL